MRDHMGNPPTPIEDLVTNFQNALDAVGVLDPTGVADFLTGAIHALRGNYGAAALSVAAIIGADILKAAKRGPSAYSVAFQTALPIPAIPKGTRPSHFKAANTALLDAMDASPEFASQIQQLVPDVANLRGPMGGVLDGSPAGWTWNHLLDQPGVMQLVPRDQHTPGSAYWWLMHQYPTGAGGFAQWGSKY
jgi:hypothetical protein